MRRMPTRAVVVVVIGIVIGIVVNGASGTLPSWVFSPVVVWPSLLLVCVAAIAAEVWHERTMPRERDPSTLAALTGTAAPAALGAAEQPNALSLVDSSSDGQVQVSGEAVPAWMVTTPQQQRERAIDFLDFKFLNHGTTAVVLHHFDVEVLSFTADLRPVLSFLALVDDDRRLFLYVRNTGWGTTRRCHMVVNDTILGQLFPPQLLTAEIAVGTGEWENALVLDPAAIDTAAFDRLVAQRRGLAEPPNSPFTQERLGLRLTLNVELIDETGQRQSFEAQPKMSGLHWVERDRFGSRVDMFGALVSSEAVSVILEPTTTVQSGYRLSRVVPPAAADRFHVMLATTQSGTYTVRVKFHTDAAEPVVSPPIQTYLRRDRDSELPMRLSDGAAFTVDESGVLVLGGGTSFMARIAHQRSAESEPASRPRMDGPDAG